MSNFWKVWSMDAISVLPCLASSFYNLFQSGVFPAIPFDWASSITHSSLASTNRIGRTRQVRKYCAEKIQWAIMSNYLLKQSSYLFQPSPWFPLKFDSRLFTRPDVDDMTKNSGVKMKNHSLRLLATTIVYRVQVSKSTIMQPCTMST